jgi:hypothetical protein
MPRVRAATGATMADLDLDPPRTIRRTPEPEPEAEFSPTTRIARRTPDRPVELDDVK